MEFLEISSLHGRTIAEVNSRDYNPAQIAVWSSRAQRVERYYLRECLLRKCVALDSQKLIGFIDYEKTQEPQTCEIGGLYVAAECQGHGIGKLLLDTVNNDALARGYRKIVLKSTITGQSFYEHHGWVFSMKKLNIKLKTRN